MLGRKPATTVIRYFLLALVIGWSILPIAFVVLSSFKHPATIFEFPPRLLFQPTFDNYLNLVDRWPQFFASLGNSAIITIGATLLTLLVALPAAYAYSRYRSGLLTASAFLMLAVRMFPPIVITLPLFPIVRSLDLNDSHIVLIIFYSTFYISLSTWVLKAFIDDIPRELDEAAQLDGANVLQIIARVILPLSRQGIIATAVFVIVYSWKEFLFAFLFTSRTARTAPVIINEMLGAVDGVLWGPLLAAATVQLLPILVFVLLVQGFLMRGLTMGATKG